MNTWEERMAARAAFRAAKADADRRQREDAERARLIAENPVFELEDLDPVSWGAHEGHRTHRHPWHGPETTVCQCGTVLGYGDIAVDPGNPWPEAEPCPVCTARGIPLDNR